MHFFSYYSLIITTALIGKAFNFILVIGINLTCIVILFYTFFSVSWVFQLLCYNYNWKRKNNEIRTWYKYRTTCKKMNIHLSKIFRFPIHIATRMVAIIIPTHCMNLIAINVDIALITEFEEKNSIISHKWKEFYWCETWKNLYCSQWKYRATKYL